MAVPKKVTFRLVSDYQAVNSQVEQTPKVMTDLLRDLDFNVWVDAFFLLRRGRNLSLVLAG